MSIITEKNKMISCYVNKEIYAKFQEVCKLQGIPANKIINSMILDYVTRYSHLLDNIDKII